MKSINIEIKEKSKRYSIDFTEKTEDSLSLLQENIADKVFLIVTDENVYELYKEKFFAKFLAKFNLKEENILVLPAGEENKNLEAIEKIWDKAFGLGLDRSSKFVAVGGGVIGDMTAFAASTFMRGTPFIQIPTTLLAMVDSSVGGKTGFDNKWGKNMVGTFAQPERVICCREFLETLNEIDWKNGLAEMIKHGILGDKNNYEEIRDAFSRDAEIFTNNSNIKLDETFAEKIWEIIPDSIKIKKKVVEQDETEAGIRKILNLGHTFGHAIEKIKNFEIPHGQAVAIGIAMSARFSQEHKFCSQEVADEIIETLKIMQLPTESDIEFAKIWEAMKSDKKKSGEKISLILPVKIGEVIIEKFNL